MSYVLDALKRADAERERGAVPGLHAQPVPLLPVDADAPRARTPWLWIGLGAALGLMAAFAWVVGNPAPPQAPEPVAAAQPAPPPPQTVPAAAVATILPDAPTRLPAVAAHPATKAADAPASAAAAPRVFALHELPEAVQRELPTLTIGGSVYSDNPTQRFLVINGRVVHENEEVATNLRLEQIKLKAAVLKYKDYRYSIVF